MRLTLAVNDKGRLVRLLACAVVALISCFFVSRYNWACSLSLERGMAPPAVAAWVGAAAPYAYAAPVLLFLLGVFLLRRGSGSIVACEGLIAISWLGAFARALTAIFARQVAHIVAYSGPH